jgi:uncharacterized protein (TIGR02246 family)
MLRSIPTMFIRFSYWAGLGGSALLTLLLVAPSAAAGLAKPAADRAADEASVRATADAFTKAFNAGDAKAIAALWTGQGEYESDDGTVLRGRPAIKVAFAAHFKGQPGAKSTVKIESIRFPSRDTAIEEGITCTLANATLPCSARYRVLHVREDGAWKIALCREWATEESRMIDLDWLVGRWNAHERDHDLAISFAHDGQFLVGEFHVTREGKSVSAGKMRIGVDPATRQFVSWHFDADGGFGHGTWLRERNHWAIDAHGVRGDGVAQASVRILSRFGDDELGWRVIDPVAGGKKLPDLPPVRLKRVAEGN